MRGFHNPTTLTTMCNLIRLLAQSGPIKFSLMWAASRSQRSADIRVDWCWVSRGKAQKWLPFEVPGPLHWCFSASWGCLLQSLYHRPIWSDEEPCLNQSNNFLLIANQETANMIYFVFNILLFLINVNVPGDFPLTGNDPFPRKKKCSIYFQSTSMRPANIQLKIWLHVPLGK